MTIQHLQLPGTSLLTLFFAHAHIPRSSNYNTGAVPLEGNYFSYTEGTERFQLQ
jgi:hypothetical protein